MTIFKKIVTKYIPTFYFSLSQFCLISWFCFCTWTRRPENMTFLFYLLRKFAVCYFDPLTYFNVCTQKCLRLFVSIEQNNLRNFTAADSKDIFTPAAEGI